MNEICGYSESFKSLCSRRKWLVGVDAEKANFCKPPLYSMFVSFLPRFVPMKFILFQSKAVSNYERDIFNFNRNNRAQIFRSLPFAEKSNFCIPPLCSMLVSFLPRFVPINFVMFQSKAVWKCERDNGTDFPKFT